MRVPLLPFLTGLAFSTVLVPSVSWAGLFRIINRTYGSATAYQAEIDKVYNDLETTVNRSLPSSDANIFLRRMGNSGAISGAGIGADYGSTFDVFMLAAGGGVGFENGHASTSELSINNVGGVGAQAQVFVGMPAKTLSEKPWLGILPPEDSKVFFGGFFFNHSQNQVTINAATFSALAQYRALGRQYYYWDSLKWGGLDVTGGVRWTQMKVVFEQRINETISEVAPIPLNPTITANYNGTIRGGAEVSVITIPVELSTSARVLYVFTPFVGIGADINIGMAKSIASISGPITATESSGTYGTLSAEGQLDLGALGSPSFIDLRGFAGIQFQAGIVALAFQTNKALGGQLGGSTISLKIYY